MQHNPENPLHEPQVIAHIKYIARNLFPSTPQTAISQDFSSLNRHFYKTPPSALTQKDHSILYLQPSASHAKEPD